MTYKEYSLRSDRWDNALVLCANCAKIWEASSNPYKVWVVTGWWDRLSEKTDCSLDGVN